MKLRLNQSGFILPTVLAIAVVLSAFGAVLATVLVNNIRFTTHEQKYLKALEVAEAGINYYLWHLSHNTTDYTDGNGAPSGAAPYGPYTHDFTDTSGNVIGQYTLYITPPPPGSTVTTVASTGQLNGLTSTRTVQAQLGIPSFATYSLVTDTEVWFGPGENSSGPVHSNIGVHFDGINNGPVTSARANYIPSYASGGNGSTSHPGVWGNGGPKAQWQPNPPAIVSPVPAVPFAQVTADIQALKTKAQSGGTYLAPAGAFNVNRGYSLVLKSNNLIDVYTVTSVSSTDVITRTLLTSNQPAPANGIYYVEDNVWVEGTWGSRITIVSGRLPDTSGTNTSIKIYNNLSYTVQDGSVAIGLIAQKDIPISRNAPATMTINGALLAQKGHVWFPDYSGTNVKVNLNFYGAIASNLTWTWLWISGTGTSTDGFPTSTTTFDTHLVLAPPPSYPTTGTFTILNWREVLTHP